MHAPAVLLRRCDTVRIEGTTRPPSNTGRPNSALSIAHPRMLAPPLAFPGVTTELTAIIGEEPIGISPSDRVWLLDSPGQVVPKRHPHLILYVPDVDDEPELRLLQTHGAGLFEIGVRIDEGGGKQGWLDTPFGRVAWILL